MTVKEAIEKLQGMQQDLPLVWFDYSEPAGDFQGGEPRDVEQLLVDKLSEKEAEWMKCDAKQKVVLIC